MIDTCEEECAKLFCQQCESIFCLKCFEFTHRSEKKKNHEKKQIEEDFIPQKCFKHENKKMDFFCVDDKVKCCSLCLISDHKYHNVISISEAKKEFKQKICNMNFKNLFSNFENKMKKLDKEIILKQKELTDLQLKKTQNVEIFESVRIISNSIHREEDVDKIIDWNLYLESKIEINKHKLYSVLINQHGELGLKDLKQTNKFKEIEKFHHCKLDWISSGNYCTFVYSGKIILLILRKLTVCHRAQQQRAIGDWKF
jgi:hypothetical protein